MSASPLDHDVDTDVGGGVMRTGRQQVDRERRAARIPQGPHGAGAGGTTTLTSLFFGVFAIIDSLFFSLYLNHNNIITGRKNI